MEFWDWETGGLDTAPRLLAVENTGQWKFGSERWLGGCLQSRMVLGIGLDLVRRTIARLLAVEEIRIGIWVWP